MWRQELTRVVKVWLYCTLPVTLRLSVSPSVQLNSECTSLYCGGRPYVLRLCPDLELCTTSRIPHLDAQMSADVRAVSLNKMQSGCREKYLRHQWHYMRSWPLVFCPFVGVTIESNENVLSKIFWCKKYIWGAKGHRPNIVVSEYWHVHLKLIWIFLSCLFVALYKLCGKMVATTMRV